MNYLKIQINANEFSYEMKNCTIIFSIQLEIY